MTLDSNGVIVGWPEGDASIQHAVERASLRALGHAVHDARL